VGYGDDMLAVDPARAMATPIGVGLDVERRSIGHQHGCRG
jgi:hypothetical protein